MTDDGGLLAAHIARALVEHRKWCRSRGYGFPPVLAAVLDAVLATNGQDRPMFGELSEVAKTGAVPTPLLLDDRESALLLGVSERTVRRLRSDKTLPTIPVGGRRLTRRSDIERYIADGGDA
jgi:excisionase family DNA binding protein